jgi:hypothetical protein
MIRAVRDVVLVIAIAWFGTGVLARDVLGWHHQARDAAITLLDLLVLIFYLVWVLGCLLVMRLARRRNRSGWGWFFIALTLSPLIGWVLLWTVSRDEGGSAASWAALQSRIVDAVKQPATALVVLGVLILAVVATWWWTRPEPESLTQRLWRECHETLKYTHPEWSDSRLDTMTKGCMDKRLLGVR